jgi:hypothetical protein
MSRFTAVREPFRRSGFVTRTSTWLTRSPNLRPGASSVTVVFAPPDSGRPSDGCTIAVAAT